MRFTTALRYEMKFLITHQQRLLVQEAASNYVQPDSHGDAFGSYKVTSLYYDTRDYRSYWDKIDGVGNRRKVRLRIYGTQPLAAESPCFWEIKQRWQNMMGKRRLRVSGAQSGRLAQSPLSAVEALEQLSLNGSAATTQQELLYLFQMNQLQPSCIVSYWRSAFEGSEIYPDLRITFDSELRGRTNDLTLSGERYEGEHYLLAPNWCVMEVKVNQTMPYWLAELLSRQQCRPFRISKYCTALQRCAAISQHQTVIIPTI